MTQIKNLSPILERTLNDIKPLNRSREPEIQAELDNLTKPRGSLGVLETLAKQYVLITGKRKISKKIVIVMAGDHGVVREGVSVFPQEVTLQMVLNFLRGGAGINVLACHAGAEVRVVDIGVAADFEEIEANTALIRRKIAYGTGNMAKTAAMTRDQAIQAIEVGIDVAQNAISSGADILATGDMGIGNTTPSSAITALLTGTPVERVTGRGTGIDENGYRRKIDIIQQAIRINAPDADDGLDVLAKVGGLEIGGLAGVILAGVAGGRPVMIDGFISGAAALIAAALKPDIKEYLIAAHVSVESGHRIVLDHLGLRPLVNLELRLGEGTGAALGLSIMDAALKILTEMATFSDANVSENC